MFILSAVEEEISVHPQDLHKTPVEAVTEAIERRYIDKVIPDLGLVVTLYDIQSIEGGFVYPSDGAAFFRTKFRIVVFRPFVGEVILGKLKSSSREGLHVSVGFFHDIFVPEHALQDPSFYSEAEKVWIWKYDDNDMYMDLEEKIRVKVTAVRFPKPPTALELEQADPNEITVGTEAKPFVPMEVVATIDGDGLGLLSWWGGDEGEE